MSEHVARAEALLLREDWGGALAAAALAVAADPDSAAAWVARGRARGHVGDLHGGHEDLSRALELAPDDPATWALRGQVCLLIGDAEGASADLQRAIELAPGSPQAAAARALLASLA